MRKSFQIHRGDDYTISLDFDADITGWVITLTVKPDFASATISLSKTKSTHDDAAAGQTSIDLTDTDTSGLNGTYCYTLTAQRSDGTMKTVLIGVITFDSSVESDDVSITVTDENETVSVEGGSVGGEGSAQTWTSETFTRVVDTTNESITFADTFTSGTLAVYKNGILAKKDSSYSEKVGNAGIDWIGTLYTDDEIEVRYAVA